MPEYNSLKDEYLISFFNNENIRYHLFNMGLINEKLDILELKKDKRLRIPMNRDEKKLILIPPAPRKIGRKNKKNKMKKQYKDDDCK